MRREWVVSGLCFSSLLFLCFFLIRESSLYFITTGIENTESRESSGWASEGKKIVASFFFFNNLLFSIVRILVPGIVSTVRMDFMAT